VRALPLQAERRHSLRASKRLLALAGDERLVDEIRAGNESAFEVAFDRHGRGVLSFCRHMLGSPEDAEEAVQHTFAAAWSDLQRNERPIRLKPWLYTIARNRCVSLLRGRREVPVELDDAAFTAGLSDEVERRSDLRALLADLGELSEEQRAALVLSELGGFSHADIAEVVGRKEADVKAIVFRARSTLADWRQGRETPCAEIREQLSNLRGGALRRRSLRHHVQHCAGCSEFREQMRAQRRMMALVLPVVPSIGLKQSVLGVVGLGGGAAGGTAAAGFGTATIAKLAVAGVVATGTVTAGQSALERDEPSRSGRSSPAVVSEPDAAAGQAGAPTAIPGVSPAGERGEAGQAGGGDGKSRGRRQEGPGASALAPPGTPVRAKGSPPALGRVRRGLDPPQTGPRTNNGRALGRQRGPADAPKQRAPKEVRPKPAPPPGPLADTPRTRGPKSQVPLP